MMADIVERLDYELARRDNNNPLMVLLRDCKAEIERLRTKVEPAEADVERGVDLEQTATMLERWAPEVFPEINERGQKHFGRVLMESAAESIRAALEQEEDGK